MNSNKWVNIYGFELFFVWIKDNAYEGLICYIFIECYKHLIHGENFDLT